MQYVTVVTPSQLQYSCNSGNVPGPHVILRVELLTPFTSGLPFLLCSPFVSTLLIRKRRLVVLLFFSIVLRSQTYLWSKLRTPCYVPFLVVVLFMPHNHLIIFRFVDTFIPMDTYTNKSCMIGSVHISTIVHPIVWASSLLCLLHLLRYIPEYHCEFCELRYSEIWDNTIVRGCNT